MSALSDLEEVEEDELADGELAFVVKTAIDVFTSNSPTLSLTFKGRNKGWHNVSDHRR